MAISGDPEHPTSHGFICPRGRAAIEHRNNPTRLSTPLRRRGARGGGDWEEVGWPEALDDIAEALLKIRSEAGAEAVAYMNGTFHGPDLNFGYRLMHEFGSPNSGGAGLVCGGPNYAAAALTFGSAPVASDVVPGVTRTVLLWANHPSASRPLLWARILEARRAGARLIVVDPRPTLEARHADLFLQPRPGTDAALALAMVRTILLRDWVDRAFVDKWTIGFDDLKAHVHELSASWASHITGVDENNIEAAALAYADSPTALVSGSPNGMGINALSFERALMILIAITGNLDLVGANRLVGPRPEGAGRIAAEHYTTLPPEQRRKRLGADQFRLHGDGFERMSASASHVWHGVAHPYSVQQLAIAHPPSIFRAILSGQPYQVRALLIQSANVVGAYSGSSIVVDALQDPKLELVVVHELFQTPTSMLADYVLPAAVWLEKPFLWATGLDEDIVVGERVCSPTPAQLTDFEFCRDLGRRLGQAWPETLEEEWDEWLTPYGESYSSLLRTPGRAIPAPTIRFRHEAKTTAGALIGFGTPSGKVELASSILDELGYAPLPTFVLAAGGRQAVPSEYPLRLMTGATRIDATHQDHRQVRSLRERHPDPTVEIDPVLGAAMSIAEGDWVRIETPRGSIRQRAKYAPGLGTDRINAERWWYPERDGRLPELFGVLEANANAWTEDDPEYCDPAFGSPPFRIAVCRISRLDDVDREGAEQASRRDVPRGRGDGVTDRPSPVETSGTETAGRAQAGPRRS